MKRRAFMLSCLLSAVANASPQYAKVLRGLALQFPRDHGAHPDFRTEWWYVTGALDLPRKDIGFQLTFFRVRTGFSEALASPIAANQILFAHAAVTVPGDKFLHAERAARANLGAGFSTADCDVHIGAWQMQRNASDVFTLKAQDAQFAFDLSLTPTQPKMLQGDAGFSQKGARAEQASYYVSWPQLQVEGSIVLDGKSQAARGKAWFDHEWSSEVLGEADVGWDWLGINLADGGALMAFHIRNAAGVTVFAHAALRDTAGRTQVWSGFDVQFKALRKWRSARGTEYPVETELRLGPHVIRTKPVIDDQELSTRRPASVTYWEGLVQVEGTLTGRGYLELTGYAGKIVL
jgi:predicted secreted hydrolase